MEVELLLVLYTNALSNDIIYNLSIYADDTAFCFKCDRVSDQWQQPELASELESDLRETAC